MALASCRALVRSGTAWSAWLVAGVLGAACGSDPAPDAAEVPRDSGVTDASRPSEDARPDASSLVPADAAETDAAFDGGSDVPVDARADANEPEPEDDASTPGPGLEHVFAHSASTLYRLDPDTLELTEVGPFTDVGVNVLDLAVDRNGHGYATAFERFYRVDLATAELTLLGGGVYPNSLSFVPRGTVDPNREALVGYLDSTYVRVDLATGLVSTIGALAAPGLVSSGDIVSVTGGSTYLTVTGPGCADCLVRVNPTTGALVESYGSIGTPELYGLGYWAGTLYGFSGSGTTLAITLADGAPVVTEVPLANGPARWFGAGSTTSAPMP